MTQPFNECNFEVSKEIFSEVLDNPDKGFGFSIELKKEFLTEIQIEVLEFLIRCYEKKLMGHYFQITFTRPCIGEIKPLSRSIEKIEKTKKGYLIKNSY